MNAAWMAYVCLLGAALAVAAHAAERALRLYRLPARGAWAASIAASVLLPLASLLRGAETPVAAELVLSPAAATVAAGAPPAETSAGGAGWAGLDALLPAQWAAATGALALAMLAGSAVLAVRRRRWRPARVAGVPVLVSERTGPAVVGVLRPAIVLPGWALGWSDARQRLIVKHEVEHVRAGDPRLLHLALVAVVLLPWNPGLWWQLRRLRLAVEIDCDGRTLAGEPDVAAYGSLLLEVGRMGTRGILPAAAFSEPRSFLERRIRMMTLRTPRRRAARAAVSLAALAGAACLAAALPAPPPPPPLLAGLAADLSPAGAADEVPVLAAPSSGIGEVRPASPAENGAIAVSSSATAIFAEEQAPVVTTQPSRAAPGDTVMPQLTNTRALARALVREYPPVLRDAGVRGTVEVSMVVTAAGTVRDVRATRASHPALAAAGVAVIRDARFRPGTVGGRAADLPVTIPLEFSVPTVATTTPALAGRGRVTATQLQGLAEAAEREYPPLLRDAGIAGRAVVRVRVDEAGRLTVTEVVSATHDAFAEAARRSLTSLRLDPRTTSPGEEMTVTVRFGGPVLPALGTTTSGGTTARSSSVERPVSGTAVEIAGQGVYAGRQVSPAGADIVLEGRVKRGGTLVSAPRLRLRRGGVSHFDMGRAEEKLTVRGRILPGGEVEVTFEDGKGATATGTARPGQELSLTLTDADLEATFTPYLVP
jgi:TonB family protein